MAKFIASPNSVKPSKLINYREAKEKRAALQVELERKMQEELSKIQIPELTEEEKLTEVVRLEGIIEAAREELRGFRQEHGLLAPVASGQAPKALTEEQANLATRIKEHLIQHPNSKSSDVRKALTIPKETKIDGIFSFLVSQGELSKGDGTKGAGTTYRVSAIVV